MARTITARRADECGAEQCTEPTRAISAGELINYGGPGAVTHAACEPIEAQRRSPGRGRRGYGRRTGYTSSGARLTSRRGRCEDAPCCGCCDA